jgi:threonine/homoserine/homoserine lactone efflux protein
MEVAAVAVFAAAYGLAAISPGPGVAALVARVLGAGLAGAPAYVAGFVGGELLWFSVAALGLAAVAQVWATAFLVLKWCGVAYLVWLAFRLWTAPAVPIALAPTTGEASRAGLFLTGLTLTLGNPKVMAFHLALLPTVIDLGRLTATGFVLLAALVVVLQAAVLVAYALMADRARRFVARPAALRAVNRLCGAAVVGAAASVALRD